MRKTHAGKVALCGMMGALAFTVMLMGNIIPCATFCAPALAGILLLPVMAECGLKFALLLFLTVALLSLFFLPDKEMACIFVFVLGYYPALKPLLDRLCRPLRLAAKLVVFNLGIAVAYSLLLLLFPVRELVQEYGAMGWAGAAALVALGNLTFLVYDAALANMQRLYQYRLRPKIARYL